MMINLTHLNSCFPKTMRIVVGTLYIVSVPCFAGLLDDNEARKAILELRTEVRKQDTQHTEKTNQLSINLTQELAQQAKQNQQLLEEVNTLKRTILDLNNMLIQTKEAHARLSGQLELLVNQQQNYATDLNKQTLILQTQQAKYIEQTANLDKRLTQLEPNNMDKTQEPVAERSEIFDFNSALAQFKAANYLASSQSFTAFITQYPRSELLANAYFWLGNAHYAHRDSKAAITVLNTLLRQFPDYAKAAEASLTLAQSYEDIGDIKRSQDVYQSIISKFPNTSAAQTAAQALPKKAVPSIKKIMLMPKKI
jgi:tol-pal system protein YbgF